MKSSSKAAASIRNEAAWSAASLRRRCENSASAMVVIKCDDFERHQLWARTTDSSVIVSGSQAMGLADGVRALDWGRAGGPMITIGESCDGRPIVAALTAQEIDCIPVCFIDCCSAVSDSKMLDDFIAAVFPCAMICDAASFHLFVDARDELKKRVGQAMASGLGPCAASKFR